MPGTTDDINDAYFDRMGMALGMQTRERVHWVCSRAQGQRVLHIGCSGGIADILMAREGKTVLAVDTRREHIDRANALLGGEDDATRGRVRFLCGDIREAVSAGGTFDTVILSEGIAAALYPGTLLEAVSGLLGEGGTAIVEAPFGAGLQPDQKNTFYLTDLAALCARYFSVAEAGVLDGSVAVVAEKSSVPHRLDYAGLVGELEAGIRAKEERLLRDVSAMKDRLGEAQGRLDACCDKLARLKGRIRQYAAESMKLQRKNAELTGRLEAVYQSLRFRLGARLVEIAKNPLKALLIPYWAIRALARRLAKRFGRRPAAGKRGPEKPRSVTFPNFRVAAVIDEISYSCFKYDCDMLKVSRKDFRGEIDAFRPDILFVESAWHGNDDTWAGVVSSAGPDLAALVDHCRSRGIPTVFWCKEDPPQYETFRPAASLFDFIFTTDAGCVPRYRADLGRETVDVLMFAVQPRLQNPIQPREGRLNRVCFAGIYYRTKFFERQKLFEALADAAMEFGLDIYDRFSYVKNTDDYKYPDKYKSALKPYVPYEELVELYKRYDVILNLNSVSDSETMFSRRVFDAVACGVCVLSTPSSGMEKLFGDIVGVARTRQEAEDFLTTVLADSLYRDKLTARGYTRIVRQHTYAARLKTIADRVGKPLPGADERHVSAVVVTMRPECMDNVFDSFVRQTWPHKELIVVVNSDGADLDAYARRAALYPDEDIRVFREPASVPLGACLNRAFDRAKYNWLVKMDDDDYFSRDYIRDELIFFDFTEAGVVGKNTFYVWFESSRRIALRYPGRENVYTDIVAGSAILFRREVFEKVRFDDGLNVSEIAAFLAAVRKEGFRVYSSHRFNHAVVRRALESHTWREPEEEYMKKCEPVEENAGRERLAEIVDL